MNRILRCTLFYVLYGLFIFQSDGQNKFQNRTNETKPPDKRTWHVVGGIIKYQTYNGKYKEKYVQLLIATPARQSFGLIYLE